MQKYILVKEEDYKQAIMIFNLLKEGKFELKGDTFGMVASAQKWLVDHIQVLKSPKDLPEEQPEVAVKPKSRGAK